MDGASVALACVEPKRALCLLCLHSNGIEFGIATLSRFASCLQQLFAVAWSAVQVKDMGFYGQRILLYKGAPQNGYMRKLHEWQSRMAGPVDLHFVQSLRFMMLTKHYQWAPEWFAPNTMAGLNMGVVATWERLIRMCENTSTVEIDLLYYVLGHSVPDDTQDPLWEARNELFDVMTLDDFKHLVSEQRRGGAADVDEEVVMTAEDLVVAGRELFQGARGGTVEDVHEGPQQNAAGALRQALQAARSDAHEEPPVASNSDAGWPENLRRGVQSPSHSASSDPGGEEQVRPTTAGASTATGAQPRMSTVARPRSDLLGPAAQVADTQRMQQPQQSIDHTGPSNDALGLGMQRGPTKKPTSSQHGGKRGRTRPGVTGC